MRINSCHPMVFLACEICEFNCFNRGAGARHYSYESSQPLIERRGEPLRLIFQKEAHPCQGDMGYPGYPRATPNDFANPVIGAG
jgi:hypothetical protein